MQYCQKLVRVFSALAAILLISQTAWGLSGTVTDNRISAGGSTVMVFAMPHQTQVDPYFAEIECASLVSGTYPNYTFDLPCVTAGNYDLGVVGWDGLPEGPPDFVSDIKLNVPYDTTGLALSIQPNLNHINGDVYEWGTGNPVTREAQIWAFDLGGNLVGFAFTDSLGHYDFGYLPAGSGPYDLVVKAEGYWEEISNSVSNPATESFILRKAFQAKLTNSENTGYTYNYLLHPERLSWVLSDASNYYLTIQIKNDTANQGAQPIAWVMFRLPGGAFAQSKFYVFPSPTAHTVDPSLDWDSVYLDQTGSQEGVVFTQGNGVQVVGPKDSTWFRIEIASMDNVPYDNYANLEVLVSTNSGSERAYTNAGMVQKILRITDLSFFPSEVDTSNQTGPNSSITLSAVVENHGNAVFYPYDNWSNIWSPAFISQGTKFLFGSLPAGGSSTMALMDVQVTGTQGSYEINCNLSDSGNNNSSWIAYEESLEVIATAVRDDGLSGNLPRSFVLYQNFPNPFNAATRIEYALAASGKVSLEIYNLLGQKVRTLVSEYQTPGYKSVSWDGKNQSGRDLTSGVYFYRLTTSQKSVTQKMTLIR